MERANSIAGSCLTYEWEQPVHQRGDSADGQRRAEAPRKVQVLEVPLPRAAWMREEQAIDQAGGHDWRCPVFRKVAFTMYLIADVARARKGNSILLHQLKAKVK